MTQRTLREVDSKLPTTYVFLPAAVPRQGASLRCGRGMVTGGKQTPLLVMGFSTPRGSIPSRTHTRTHTHTHTHTDRHKVHRCTKFAYFHLTTSPLHRFTLPPYEMAITDARSQEALCRPREILQGPEAQRQDPKCRVLVANMESGGTAHHHHHPHFQHTHTNTHTRAYMPVACAHVNPFGAFAGRVFVSPAYYFRSPRRHGQTPCPSYLPSFILHISPSLTSSPFQAPAPNNPLTKSLSLSSSVRVLTNFAPASDIQHVPSPLDKHHARHVPRTPGGGGFLQTRAPVLSTPY